MTSVNGLPVHSLAIGRLIRAPIALVFGAWIDPALMPIWFKPRADIQTEARVDPKIGGALRIVMHDGAHDEVHEGQYRVIEPPNRLSFSWSSGAAGPDSAVDLSFLASDDDRTMLLLKHHGLKDRRAEENHREGWRRILDRLGEILESGRPASNGPQSPKTGPV
jgi:uncharacterized protein YndB with AHSA1/START domain